MRILLVSATDFEIAPVIQEMQLISQEDDHFKQFIYNDLNIDVLITGVGIPFTIYQLSSALFNKHYDLAINIGIAGSFHESIPLGSVIHVVNERFADIGIEEKGTFKSIFEISLHNKNQYPFRNGILENNIEFYYAELNTIKKVSAVTVNKVSGNLETINFIRDTYNPDIESMEGAAFFYVCKMEKIPFFQIRAISNFIEERDTSKWNIKLAVTNLNMKMRDILSSIRL